MFRTFLVMLCFFVFSTLAFSQEQEPKEKKAATTSEKEETKEITGFVESISKDGTFLVVDKKKLITTQEFLDESFIEVGDKVKIFYQVSPQGPKVVDYEYVYVPVEEKAAHK